MLLVRVIGLLGCSSLCYGGIAAVEATIDDPVKLEGTPDNSVRGGAKDVPEASGNEALPDDNDTYSMYKQLMNMREEMAERQEKKIESEALVMVKTAMQVIMETAIHSFINGFLPTVDRVRREANEEKKGYLDGVVYIVGALIGKKDCSNMIACRAGKMVQERMPGAQLAVMMAESMVPKTMLSFFGVVKRAVIDRSDACETEYNCVLTEEREYPEE